MSNNKLKIGLISSKGGHLVELVQLDDVFKEFSHFWVTFSGEDVAHYLKGNRVYFAHFPESRNILNLVRNFFLAVSIFIKEKPNVLISAGAGIAIPFFIVGKFLFGCRLVYVESYDFVSYPSLTGKVLYNIVDLFLIQHLSQKKWYPKAKHWGSLL